MYNYVLERVYVPLQHVYCVFLLLGPPGKKGTYKLVTSTYFCCVNMTFTTFAAMRRYLSGCDEEERDCIENILYGDTSVVMQNLLRRVRRDRERYINAIANDMPIGTAFWDLCQPSLSIDVSTYILTC